MIKSVLTAKIIGIITTLQITYSLIFIFLIKKIMLKWQKSILHIDFYIAAKKFVQI